MHNQRRISANPHWPILALLPGALACAAPAFAQQADNRFDSLDALPREGYEPRTIRSGSLVIRPELDIGGEYDSNLFADNSGEVDDVALVATPRIAFKLDRQLWEWSLQADTTLRRYVDNSSENSTTFGVKSDIVARPTETTRLGGGVGFVRAAEERGDPEARLTTGNGPRLFNDLAGNLYARMGGRRVGVQVSGEVEQFDYLSAIDNGRDRVEYRAGLRGYYRATELVSVFAEGFASWRNYRLATDDNGITRDSKSYGVNAGVQIDPGGKVRGEAYAGVFRFDPDDPLLKRHTGVELGANLFYSATERTTFTLEAFRGDVGTVRLGATGRTDTRVRLGIEQEARHNLLIKAGATYKETQFRGLDGSNQQKWGGDLEVEYLLNRHASLAATAIHLYRNSDGPAEDYVRFRGGLALRLKY